MARNDKGRVEFQKHYTIEEARALLPKVREWLQQLLELRREVETCDGRLSRLLAERHDLGGALVNSWVRGIAQMKSVFLEFYRREIQIKDLDRGLVDFPALLNEKEVFLCWERGEADIEFWHDLKTGYAGRRRLDKTAED